MRATERRQQIGATDVSDEQRVASEHGVRLTGLLLIDHDADRLGCVAGCFEHFEPDITEVNASAVAKLFDGEVGQTLGRRAISDARTSRSSKLEMATHEVGVKMSLNDVLNGETKCGCISEIVRHVSLRVDDDGTTTDGVTDKIRRV